MLKKILIKSVLINLYQKIYISIMQGLLNAIIYIRLIIKYKNRDKIYYNQFMI